MSDIKKENLQIDENVSLGFINNKISISIKGMNKLAFVDYTDELFEIIKTARFRVPKPEKVDDYKYPYSNEYRKALHHIVFDYYFGEDLRKKLVAKQYVIEHLDNDGFNCQISNLYTLKEIKNFYKGIHFDKEVKEALPIIALRIYHVISNKTFQIAIAFNQTFINTESGKTLSKLRLLYDYDYEIVLQDAEQILESIIETGTVNFDKWKESYRFKDMKLCYAEVIELTEDEKKQGVGTFIERDGEMLILVGRSQKSYCLITSIPYEEDWDFRNKE